MRYHEGVSEMGGWFSPGRWVKSFKEGSSLGADAYRTILGLVGCKRIADGSTRLDVPNSFVAARNDAVYHGSDVEDRRLVGTRLLVLFSFFSVD